MANINKKTINTYFDELSTIVEKADFLSETEKTDYKDFLAKRIKVNAKKNTSGTKKQTANQVANNALSVAIYEYLKSTNAKMTIGEMMKSIPECEDLSNQKINGVLRYMYDSEKNPNPNPMILREEVKGKAYFSANPDYMTEVEGE